MLRKSTQPDLVAADAAGNVSSLGDFGFHVSTDGSKLQPGFRRLKPSQSYAKEFLAAP